ncbi:hypothetical protein QR680_011470 [Steinernema hermaphroditum]|uniref:Aquaporin n=1 Tax=Steinernema hermaphroditum TaxID=289476 RepID=A0AA39HZU6_9BILA|nr:hypothetical protein QR680_011470 [Steinernema hermaphroditum]
MRVWVASLLFYSFCFVVAEILRKIVERLYVGNEKRKSKTLLLEFIGTMQVCAPMFDVGIILETYGLVGVFIEITVLELANGFWLRDCIAHPCPLVTSCVRGHKALKWIVSVFTAQLAAAYLSFYLARTFWRLGVHPLHTELLEADHCDADLTVAILTGSVVEFMATFSAKAVEYLSKRFHAEDSFWAMLVNCSFSGYACTLGIHLTGMYGNPIVAWACTFNCRGATHKAHLAVYWLSPLVAWWVAEALFGFEEDEYEEYVKEREVLKKISEVEEDEDEEEEDGDTVADAESLVDHEVTVEGKKDK